MKLKKLLTRTLSMLLAGAMVITGGVGMFANAAEESTVVTYGVASCYSESDVASMTVNGTKVPVIKFLSNYDHAQFSFDGTANIEITVKENIETFSVSPLAKNIVATANGKKLSFTITESLYMIVKINGIKEIVVIADDLETDVPDSSGEGIYNIVEDYGADTTWTTSVVEPLQQAIDDANAAGGGIVYVPEGLYKLDGNIRLKSNVHLYLAGGSVIRSVSDRANYVKHSYKDSISKDVTWTFTNDLGAENIKIYGRGTVDGNGSAMYSKLAATLFYIRQADNLKMDGIVIRDGNFWTIEPKMVDGAEFTNLKVLNDFDGMTENDAIDICESRDVLVKHMLAISEDDTYSTKTYTSKGLLSGETTVKTEMEMDNVTFDDCFGWTHCGTFKVGDGSNFTQSNITFKNSYSYKCMQAIKVSHAYGGADYVDIVFDNIDIEGYGGRVATDRRWLLVDTFSGNAENPGNVEGLTIKNINIRDLGSKASTMKGRENQAYVYGVTFENIKVPGQAEYASSLEEMNITDTNIQGTSDYKILPIDNTVKYDTTGNLAYNENVAATCSSIESETFMADKAIDGDAGTRWTSGATDSEWMMLDFGETISFNRVRILWEAAYGTDYKIQYSDDATTWKDAIVVTGGDGNTDILDFERVSGRYVRFLGTKRVQDKNGFSFYEFEVYNFDDYDKLSLSELTVQLRLAKRDYTDTVLKQYTDDSAAEMKAAMLAADEVVNSENPTGITDALTRLTTAKANLVKRAKPTSEYNMALKKPVTVSGVQNDNSAAKNAVDGSSGSCWRSQMSGAPFWITVDLGENDGYDMVVINWEDSYATNYKLCVSDDNENWTDITVNGETYLSAPSKTEQTLYLDEIQTAKYLRMYCLEKASMYGVGIYELEVYSTAADKPADIMMGDVNGDGKINSTDFMQVRRHYLGLYTIPEESISAADVNRDGKINSTDFMQIRRHFLGLFTIA